MAYWAQVRNADDVVDGIGSGSALPTDGATNYIFELSGAEYAEVRAKGFSWGGDPTKPRWKIVTNALEEQADPRRLVVFTPDTVVIVYANNQTVSVAVEVRQLADPDLIDTSINGTFNVFVEGRGPGMADLWVQITISSGEGTLLIDREVIKEARISDQAVFRVETPLQVRVLAPGRF
jgi:hypothetical protein